MPAFFQKKHFCTENECMKAYNNYEHHHCNHFCKSCTSRKCKRNEGMIVICNGCKAKCNSNECLMGHVDLEICKKLKLCNQCSKYLGLNHVCVDQRWCKNCKVAVPMDHMCFILTQQERDHNKSDQKFNGYVFFDYECMNQDGLHIPNLVIAQKTLFRLFE
jgi:hypothetical protein